MDASAGPDELTLIGTQLPCIAEWRSSSIENLEQVGTSNGYGHHQTANRRRNVDFSENGENLFHKFDILLFLNLNSVSFDNY